MQRVRGKRTIEMNGFICSRELGDPPSLMFTSRCRWARLKVTQKNSMVGCHRLRHRCGKPLCGARAGAWLRLLRPVPAGDRPFCAPGVERRSWSLSPNCHETQTTAGLPEASRQPRPLTLRAARRLSIRLPPPNSNPPPPTPLPNMDVVWSWPPVTRYVRSLIILVRRY